MNQTHTVTFEWFESKAYEDDGDGWEIEIEATGDWIPYSAATMTDPEEGGYYEDVTPADLCIATTQTVQFVVPVKILLKKLQTAIEKAVEKASEDWEPPDEDGVRGDMLYDQMKDERMGL